MATDFTRCIPQLPSTELPGDLRSGHDILLSYGDRHVAGSDTMPVPFLDLYVAPLSSR